jgi:uncharacterized membrane protein
MGFLYFTAGVLHFTNPGFYLNIMPPYIPLHLEMVYLSGIIEIVLGVGLIPARTRAYSAWAIIAMLIAFMPVHVHMIINHAELFAETPLWMLWLRIPLQAMLILWAWVYTRPVEMRSDS